MIQHEQLTFGKLRNTTLVLTAEEQYCNQVGIHEQSQHDLRVFYVPLVDDDMDVKLETRIYLSDQGMSIEALNSNWYPMAQDIDDGTGRKSAQIRVLESEAHSSLIEERNPSRSFPVGAKKIRFGFKEVGSPSSFGSITEATISSRM